MTRLMRLWLGAREADPISFGAPLLLSVLGAVVNEIRRHLGGFPPASEPSRADELLTANLKSALAVVDVRVLDHFVVAQTAHVSFAQRGLLQERPRYG